MPSGDLAFIICNVNALSEELVLRSNLESPALRVYRSLITCQHIYRFSVQWGEARDTIHFLGTIRQRDPHDMPGDQMLYIVTTNECVQDPLWIGWPPFSGATELCASEVGLDDSKFEPVFSLLPVDLYTAVLLPLYGAFNRHTIKLALALQCSKGVNQSPPQFELVVQVRASSPSSTAAAPDSITSTPTNVPNGSAPVTGSTIGEPTTGNSMHSYDRAQTASFDVAPEKKTPPLPSGSNGSDEKFGLLVVKSMSPTNLLSLSSRNKISNLLPVTAKSRETISSGLVPNLLPRTAKSLETNCTPQVQHLQFHGQVAVMGRVSKRIKTGPFALETLSQSSAGPQLHQHRHQSRERSQCFIATRKKKELAEALVPDLGGRNLVHSHSYPKVLLSSTDPLKLLLRLINGSNHVQQDERSEESSRARVACDEHHARKEAEEQARLRVKEQARKEADEQAHKEAQEQARMDAEEKASKEAEEQAHKGAEEQAHKEAQEQARMDAEEQARKEAEEQARKEAGEQAQGD
jgi:hypothetical protein